MAGGCISTTDDGDGAHLIAQITAPSEFDQLFLTYNGVQNVLPIDPPAMTYDWDHWEVFTPVEDIKVTAALAGNAVASGEASHISYAAQDDGTMYARILLPLSP